MLSAKISCQLAYDQHLSYPNSSVNNYFIDPDLCAVLYASFDGVIDMIFKLGPGALLAKIDIKMIFGWYRFTQVTLICSVFQLMVHTTQINVYLWAAEVVVKSWKHLQHFYIG